MGTEVLLKVETDFLMNTVTAVRNTNAHALFSSPPVQVSNFFFFNTFSHLARSDCCKLSPLVKISFLHLRPPSFFFHLLLPSLLFPAALAYRFIFSHAIVPAIFLAVCSPSSSASRLLSLFLSLSPAAWLIHFIVCSLQVYPRKSTPAVDRLCVGVPAAEVSQMLLNHTSAFSSL